ncbi:hypothetical protein DLM45_12960 [Hyphomicrobium methylovorum]|uniref:hypothetical protein n=1 Tax=Hyphomicrobium methylovorum TaxID=84 RepID=UPI0015E756F4|nr:hypothetical protein [Hyphomicrobium methylovorum]MBA2127123.1 hypothetical protein [Hyphomicrobium methylovorum]
MNDYWFKPRRYGYGATPTNWKGWLSVAAFIAIVAGISNFAVAGPGYAGSPTPWELFASFALIAALTAGFALFTRSKTDGEWRWRWGSTDSK